MYRAMLCWKVLVSSVFVFLIVGCGTSTSPQHAGAATATATATTITAPVNATDTPMPIATTPSGPGSGTSTGGGGITAAPTHVPGGPPPAPTHPTGPVPTHPAGAPPPTATPYIPPPTATPVPRADVHISSIVVDPNPPAAGTDFYLIIYATNTGSAASGHFNLDFHIVDQTRGGTYPGPPIPEVPMYPGDMYSIYTAANTIVNCEGDTYVITATIEPVDYIDSNSNDKTFITTFKAVGSQKC